MGLFIVFIALLLLIFSVIRKLSDYLHIKMLFIDFQGRKPVYSGHPVYNGHLAISQE